MESKNLQPWSHKLTSEVLFSIIDVTQLFRQLSSISCVHLHNTATVVPRAAPCTVTDHDPSVLGSLLKDSNTILLEYILAEQTSSLLWVYWKTNLGRCSEEINRAILRYLSGVAQGAA